MTEAEDFQARLRQDAAVLNASDFVKKYGKSNLHIFDRVRNEIDRCVGAWSYLRSLLAQSKKYVYDSPNLDYSSLDVETWRSWFIDECDRVLNADPNDLEDEMEENDGTSDTDEEED